MFRKKRPSSTSINKPIANYSFDEGMLLLDIMNNLGSHPTWKEQMQNLCLFQPLPTQKIRSIATARTLTTEQKIMKIETFISNLSNPQNTIKEIENIKVLLEKHKEKHHSYESFNLSKSPLLSISRLK